LSFFAEAALITAASLINAPTGPAAMGSSFLVKKALSIVDLGAKLLDTGLEKWRTHQKVAIGKDLFKVYFFRRDAPKSGEFSGSALGVRTCLDYRKGGRR
jgi:hypothetical protein